MKLAQDGVTNLTTTGTAWMKTYKKNVRNVETLSRRTPSLQSAQPTLINNEKFIEQENLLNLKTIGDNDDYYY